MLNQHLIGRENPFPLPLLGPLPVVPEALPDSTPMPLACRP